MRPCPLEIEHSHKLQEDYVLQATQLMTSTDVRRMMECRYSWDLSQGATPFVIQKAYIFGEIFVHSRSSTRDCHLYACDGWLKHHPQPLTRGLLAEKGACRLYPRDHDGTQSPIKLSLLLKSPLMFAANYISSRHIMSKYVRPVFIPWFSACIPYISIPTISQLFSQLIVPSPSADVSYISFILHYSRLFDMIHLERYADRLIDRQTDLYTELWTFCKYTHACVLFHVYYININIYIYTIRACVCVPLLTAWMADDCHRLVSPPRSRASCQTRRFAVWSRFISSTSHGNSVAGDCWRSSKASLRLRSSGSWRWRK